MTRLKNELQFTRCKFICNKVITFVLQDTEQNKKRLDIVKGRQSDFSGNKYFDNLAIETWNLEKLIRRVQEF
ncbi:MAG: hypothetical protein WB988_24015 [Candidatus Nitrosopolaris sp.]